MAYRTFNGKRYQETGTYNKKRDAQKQAKRFRDGGESARVVWDKGIKQWALYVRYGKGRG